MFWGPTWGFEVQKAQAPNPAAQARRMARSLFNILDPLPQNHSAAPGQGQGGRGGLVAMGDITFLMKSTSTVRNKSRSASKSSQPAWQNSGMYFCEIHANSVIKSRSTSKYSRSVWQNSGIHLCEIHANSVIKSRSTSKYSRSVWQNSGIHLCEIHANCVIKSRSTSKSSRPVWQKSGIHFCKIHSNNVMKARSTLKSSRPVWQKSGITFPRNPRQQCETNPGARPNLHNQSGKIQGSMFANSTPTVS